MSNQSPESSNASEEYSASLFEKWHDHNLERMMWLLQEGNCLLEEEVKLSLGSSSDKNLHKDFLLSPHYLPKQLFYGLQPIKVSFEGIEWEPKTVIERTMQGEKRSRVMKVPFAVLQIKIEYKVGFQVVQREVAHINTFRGQILRLGNFASLRGRGLEDIALFQVKNVTESSLTLNSTDD
jgi:hypothetical protein